MPPAPSSPTRTFHSQRPRHSNNIPAARVSRGCQGFSSQPGPASGEGGRAVPAYEISTFPLIHVYHQVFSHPSRTRVCSRQRALKSPSDCPRPFVQSVLILSFFKFTTVFCRFQMTMQRPGGSRALGRAPGSRIPQPRLVGREGSRIGCKYFAYCLIKHKQTSAFGQGFIELLLCARK